MMIFVLFFIVYQNYNVDMHQISSCIMSLYIMLCYHHKFHGTNVLCKEGWENFQHDYIHKRLPCS
jgi:hypothetical protein